MYKLHIHEIMSKDQEREEKSDVPIQLWSNGLLLLQKKNGDNKILIKRESLESVIKILKRLGVWMLPEREGQPRRFSNQQCDTRLFFKKLALRHPTKNEDGPYISSKVGLHFFFNNKFKIYMMTYRGILNKHSGIMTNLCLFYN